MPASASEFNSAGKAADKNINKSVNATGQTLLHLAVQNDDMKAVERLLGLGAAANARDTAQKTPLFFALSNGNLEMVRLLASRGAAFNIEDKAGHTPLQWAIQNGADAAILEELRALGADPAFTNQNQRSALHVAAEENNVPALTWLLEQRLPVDALNSDGETALHCAAEGEAHETMRLLLAAGADPLMRTSGLETPLYIAAKNGDEDALDILLEHDDVLRTINDHRSYLEGYSPLLAAVAGTKALDPNGGRNFIAIAERLLDLGAYINAQDHKNRHSLFIAIESGNADMARMLIRRGVDVAKAPTLAADGQGMLHKINTTGYGEKLRMLIEAGADINGADNDGKTALHRAAESCDVDRIRALLEQGADPNLTDITGRRPIERALDVASQVYYYSTSAADTVALLLANGASPDISPSEKVRSSPLHMAARIGNITIVHALLNAGAAVDVPERETGITPWLAAVGADKAQICEVLRQKGADTLVKDNKNAGVLHHATRAGMAFMIETALKKPEVRELVNEADDDGNTPLHIATNGYRPEPIRMLLANGADPFMPNAKGLSVLHQIVRAGNEIIFNLFLNAGKNGGWNVQSVGELETPLHLVAKLGPLSQLDRLLKLDPDLTIQDVRGYTPLMSALMGDQYLSTRSLITAMKIKNISIDEARDITGLAALHVALNMPKESLRGVTALLEAGSDVNVRTENGDTALHLAVAKGRLDLVELLLKHGADMTLTNNAGATALDVARVIGKTDIFSALRKAAPPEALPEQPKPHGKSSPVIRQRPSPRARPATP